MLRHFLKYLAGDMSVKILGFLSLPLYSYYLSPEKYGAYALVISYVTIAVVVLPLNVHASVSRFFYEDTLNIKIFMSTTLSLTLLIYLLSLIVIFYIDINLINGVLGFDFDIFGIPVLVLVFLRILFDVYKQTLIPQRKSKEYSLLMFLKTVMSLFLVIGGFILIEPNPINMIYSIIIAELLISVYIMIKLKVYFPLSININSSKYIVNYSVFLMPYVLSTVLMSQIDTIMLAKYNSTREVGIYNVAFVLSLVPLMLFTTFSNAWTPKYFEYMKNEEYELLNRDVIRILIGVSILVFLVSLFSSEIIYILVDEEFNESANVLKLLSISVFFMVLWQIWAKGIAYKKKTIWTSVIGITTAVINIYLNYYLIPLYSMNGAVFATLLSFLFMSFAGYYVSRYVLKIYTVDFFLLRYVFLFNLVTLGIAFIQSQIVLTIIKIVFFLIICSFIIYYRSIALNFFFKDYNKSND
jgi:O-antigen/teichoic acid export membrane protein